MTYRRMAFFVAGTAPVLVALIVLGGSGIFFLLPRMSAGYLGSFAAGGDMTTGFSDHVQLGRIGQIQQSNAVVMHVEIDGDKHGLHDLKWRGIALNQFDGQTWSSATEQFPLAPQEDGRFPLWRSSRTNPFRAARPLHYRVLMEPIGTNIFFLAPRPRFLSGNYRMLATDRGGTAYNMDSFHPIGVYEADSDLEAAGRALESVPGTITLDLHTYLQLPVLDSRISELAQSVTAAAVNPVDKAAAIERYLMTNFGYTLELPQQMPKDPLADFLFVRKRGHCEYFASSMAIMLRTIGIPSRVVNGFRTSEFNDLTGQYVVRASSAHSWVEAYFQEYGWTTFDPTPGSGPISGATGWQRARLYVDAMASFWREWVIDYDASHQKQLGEDAIRGSRTLIDRIRDWAQRHYARMLARARHVQRRISQSPRRWTGSGILLTVVLLAAANARTLLRWAREQRLAAHPEGAPVQAAALWYRRMLRWLARQGWKKTAEQTPKEFLIRIEDPAVRKRVEDFTRAYEAARFGESSEDARRLPGLYEEIKAAER
jgi:transglutaminase-like putative cysteine protease